MLTLWSPILPLVRRKKYEYYNCTYHDFYLLFFYLYTLNLSKKMGLQSKRRIRNLNCVKSALRDEVRHSQ